MKAKHRSFIQPERHPFSAVWSVASVLLLIAPLAEAQHMTASLPGPQRDWTGGDVAPPKPYLPIDPLREIDGQPCSVNPRDTNNWAVFAGTVLQVHGNGAVRIQGQFTGHPYAEFMVVNYPYEVVEDQVIGYDNNKSLAHYAKIAGTYTYSTVAGSSRTIYKLDYGQIYTPPLPPPPTAEQIAARRAVEAAKRKKAEANTIKWLEELVATNDAYGELRMGERYRDGDGVEKDLVKARLMLEKSAAQGNKDAAEALKNLAVN